MRYIEQANGPVYTEGTVSIQFPYGQGPRFLYFKRWMPIANPERFGQWETPAQRRAYVRAFTASEIIVVKRA